MTREQLANSPSLPFLTEKHGSAEKAREEEVRRRRDTCGFLCETGQKLRMPQLTIATAIVFYHRFFAHKSYEAYDEYNVATTCLFLGSKVEETPKKLKDVIIESAKIKEPAKPPPDADSRDFHVEKERILICERVLLQTLAFDLSVEHAYRPLLAYVKSIKGTRDLAQVAWNFINDSLRTTICLQYAPRCVSAACVFLAAKYLSEKQKKAYALPPYNGGKWYEAFQVTEEVLKDVSDQIMELYPKQDESATSNGTDSATLSGADAGALISRASPAAAVPKAQPPRRPFLVFGGPSSDAHRTPAQHGGCGSG